MGCTLLAAPAAAHGSPREDVEAVHLGEEVRVEDVLRFAFARNPDLGETRARTAAATARARQAGRIPELQLKYEQWGVPLRTPWDLRRADALMVGVSQTLPAPGTLRARSAVAESDREVASLGERTRRRDLVAEVRRAFAEYYRTDRQLHLHQEHIEVTQRLLEVARGAYRTGNTGQQDVLRLTLELSRIHGQLARTEPELLAARALLNALMNRPPDAPLGRPAEPPAPVKEPVTGQRSELAAAERIVKRSEAALKLAEQNASWPTLMLGLDYMYMPMNDHAHGYGAMVALNIPWLSPGRRDEVRAAEQTALADRRALDSTRSAVNYELVSAQARYEAALRGFEILETDVLVQAERNFEAARAAYAAGRGDAVGLLDALRSYLDVRIERVRARAELLGARAELARVAEESVP